MMRNLGEIIKRGAQNHPTRTALVFGQKKIAYADLYQKATSVAVALRKRGVQKGDRLALLLDNSPEFVFCYFGILMSHGIAVPINHMFKREEIKYILEDSQSLYLITSPVYAQVAQDLLVIVAGLRNVIYTGQLSQEVPEIERCPEPPSFDSDDTAVFLYTSGTTGHPKAAMLSHGNLLSNVLSSSQAIRVTPKDAVICFLPLFHSFAATVCMLMPLYNGAKVVILKSPRPIKKLLRSIRKNRVTIFVGIPSIYGILREIKLPKHLPSFVLRLFNPIRLAISGAAALPAEVFIGFEKKYGIPLLEGYGLTEASPVVSLNPLRGPRLPGSIGRPIPGVEVKIVDDNGNDLPANEAGELCVRGPNVMKGYFGKDDENKSVLKNNWLLTGDMAKINDEGYIYIMGRKKEMINVRGLNVYPREIEEVLYQNPKIKEAAVIGLADPHKGEIPKGFVVLRSPGSMTEREIISYLKEHIALYKVPRRIEIREELPKNSTGKILKRLLT